MKDRRYSFLGLAVDDLTKVEAVKAAMDYTRGHTLNHILFLNTDVIVKADRNVALRDAIESSSLSLMDGKPPLFLAKLKGVPLREKVSGSDFVPSLLDVASKKGLSVFILGGNETASLAAANNIRKKYPDLCKVWSYSPPMGFEQSVDEIVCMVNHVRRAQPDIMIVCFGCPKQEIIVHGLIEEFCVPCVVSAGATVDFLAGTIERAPKWMSQIGLEWFFRFLKEPRRLFRRYFIESWHLVSMMANDGR